MDRSMKEYSYEEELDHTDKFCDCEKKTKLIWTRKGGVSERWCPSCGKTHENQGGSIYFYGKPNWKQSYVNKGYHLK